MCINLQSSTPLLGKRMTQTPLADGADTEEQRRALQSGILSMLCTSLRCA